MKIILKDNYDSETKSDILVAENVLPYHAEKIVKLLNSTEDPEGAVYYKAVPDDYVLFEFTP